MGIVVRHIRINDLPGCLCAGIVEALVDAANDKDESTQVALCKAIVDIGIKKHVSVIKICLNYLTKYTKVRSECVAVSPE